jgi:nicotinate-nucleotide--dimethylbenzimidazole phosphoribosyltransferase
LTVADTGAAPPRHALDGVEAAARRALDQKTKPPGSLGVLEDVAIRLAVLQGTERPEVERGRIIVFAGDHGVAAEGVSAYPQVVTGEMVRNFARRGAAVNVLAGAAGLDVEVVNAGVAADLADVAGVVHAAVRPGTRSFVAEPAMTADETAAAIEVGRAAARRAAADGAHAIGLGEMGIANTTAAAALLSALTGASPELTVGRGTGVDDDGVLRKRDVVARGLALHADALADPRTALAALGGLEIAAIAGAALEAPLHGMAVVADGFISTVGVLAAARMDPSIHRALFFAHRSAERGHGLALEALGGRPLLDLDLRLGEGTGAALAIPLLRAAARILRDMATFQSAGVSGAER